MQDKMQQIKKQIDIEIEKSLTNDNPLVDALYKSAVYSASGGKRVRALFTYLVAGMFDVDEQKLLHPACAVELIHAASLIMDDLPYMDDSQLRRGKPANHVVFGQDVALLASIGLIAEATKLILTDEGLDQEVRNRCATVLVSSFGFDGLAAGQFVDLKLKSKTVDFKIIEFINEKKTAALFTAAGKIASVIGRANPQQLEAVQNFSEGIGFAFQIIDDMLDIAGDEKIVGKTLEHDKMNFVKLVGKKEARKYIKKYHEKAEKALSIFGEKADKLKAFSRYLIERAY